MQPWPLESSQSRPVPNDSPTSPSAPQDGFLSQHPHGNALPRSSILGIPTGEAAGGAPAALPEGINPVQLDERLRRLSVKGDSANDTGKNVAGQRIIDYENSAMTPSTLKHALGFKVVKRVDGHDDDVQLSDLPNGAFLSGGLATLANIF